MLVYDFEVYKFDWLVVIADLTNGVFHEIVNDAELLQGFYEKHKGDIWVGFNSRNYDQFITRSLLLDFDPKEVNDWIIIKKRSGWEFSRLFYKIPLINYDVMPNPPIGLKTMEGMMGHNIKETDVDFKLNRKLTAEEIKSTLKYCRHDVEETAEVLMQRKSEFDAMFQMVKVFKMPLSYIGKTDAGITAKVLDCVRTNWKDEYDYQIEPFIKLNRYQSVMDWFKNAKRDCMREVDAPVNSEEFRKHFYQRSLTTVICGVPHVDGWGGIHGAPTEPIHRKGSIWHVDVGSYYPSYLIAHDRVTRSARHPEKYAEVYHTRMALKKAGKKSEQAPYKKLLNSLSGAMKDKTNPAYDPCMNNTMVVNCQLMLIMLLEWLEDGVEGFELIQSNTDGLIVWIPDTDEAFEQLDDICYKWEQTCSTDKCAITLAFDEVTEIYQKDVNNYMFRFSDGRWERKGAYVKELSPLDNDLPIINQALVDYMSKGIHPADTINACDELIKFQKIVKLSDKYDHVEHNNTTYTYKCYRVFASKNDRDGRIYKCKNGKNPEKFANTPDRCFINNNDITGMKCPSKLDKQWYVNLAKKRLKDFGVVV